MKKIITLLGLLAIAGAANAAIIYSGNGLSGTFETENFDINAGASTIAGSQFDGITFDAGNYVNNSYSGVYANMTNSVISNFYSGFNLDHV